MMEKQKSKIFPCGKCEQCLVKDCSFCVPCLDKKKFGGKNRLRKKCVLKICPIQEKLKQEQQALEDSENVTKPLDKSNYHLALKSRYIEPKLVIIDKQTEPIHEKNENESNNPRGKENTFENYIIANPDGTIRCIVETIYGIKCNAVFKSKAASRNAARHFQTVHEKLKPFECVECKRCFSTKQVLNRHYVKKHENKNFSKNPHEHQISKENNPYLCYLCDADFEDEESRYKHIVAVHDGKKPDLDFINYVLVRKEHFHKEKENFHVGKEITQEGKEYVYEGNDCIKKEQEFDVQPPSPKQMSDTDSKKQQILGGNSLFSCYSCDAVFEDQDSIRKHVENCVVHDKKELIIDRKMYDHEGKDNFCLGKEYVDDIKENFHAKEENFCDEKLYHHKEKDDVHEKKENDHEEKEFVHEGKELDFDAEEDNLFSCYLCDAGFEDEASLRNHVENCGKIFYCAKCNGNFKSKQNLEEHVVLVHDEKLQVCEEKSYVHEEKDSVLEGSNYNHERKEHIQEGKEYFHKEKECTQEDKKEYVITESPEFKKTENVDKLLLCPVCNKSSESYDNLYNHIKENHDFMKCGVCGEKFKNLMQYRIHNSREHKGKGNVLKYQWTQFLLQGSTTRKNLTCPICFESYEGHENLKTHYLSIHENKNHFQGKSCNNSFESELKKLKKDYLHEEIELVHEEKKYFYESSNPSKKRKKNTFEDHITANPDGTFTCIYGSCNKIIKKYRYATRHIQGAHEKLKPFECAVCKRCFSAKQVLIRHYMTAHKVVKQNKEIKPVYEGKVPVYEGKGTVYEANNHTQDGKKNTWKEFVTTNPDGKWFHINKCL